MRVKIITLAEEDIIVLADQMNNQMSVLIEFNNAFTAANLDFHAASMHQQKKDRLFSNAEKGARNAMNVQWSLHENDYFSIVVAL